MEQSPKLSRNDIRPLALAAAEKLLVEQGEKAVSARKVVQEIGCAAGTLYLVFKNIDELIALINLQTLDQLYECLKQARSPRKRSKSGVIKAMGMAYWQYAQNNSNRWSSCISSNNYELLEDEYRQRFDQIIDLFEDVIKDQQMSLFAQSFRPQAMFFWASMQGILISSTDSRTGIGQADYEEMISILSEKVA